ncbi:MAG: hypothetical protein LBQ88_22595 [Treponema sp.]|jgi:hypothetical protein|nr:hypothetical protein [Treponema sp.]
MMLRFFKNHFGIVVSIVIALILSISMATTAIFYDKLDFSIELLVRNWGTAFLTIMLITVLLPVKQWGDMLATKIGLKPKTFPFGLFSNLVPTLFYNTGATLVLVGVNVPGGFAAPFYWDAFKHDFLMMYAVSYVLSLIAEAIAVKIAIASCMAEKHLEEHV